MIRGANYEVLFSTMWYDAPLEQTTARAVVAIAVVDLYRQLQALSRIISGRSTGARTLVLGNPPEMARAKRPGSFGRCCRFVPRGH
ncbi:MAG: hypothetical protein IPJ94_27725 [Chloroflexi bacterium]|nr:hypothetical protein [Chloroflexota bacterium]